MNITSAMITLRFLLHENTIYCTKTHKLKPQFTCVARICIYTLYETLTQVPNPTCWILKFKNTGFSGMDTFRTLGVQFNEFNIFANGDCSTLFLQESLYKQRKNFRQNKNKYTAASNIQTTFHHPFLSPNCHVVEAYKGHRNYHQSSQAMFIRHPSDCAQKSPELTCGHL